MLRKYYLIPIIIAIPIVLLLSSIYLSSQAPSPTTEENWTRPYTLLLFYCDNRSVEIANRVISREEFIGKIELNVSDWRSDLAKKYEISECPTYILLSGITRIWSASGGISETVLYQKLKELIT
ncbi:MAG: hypothetical protein QW507_02740 [Candidatus Nanoarchaeia archaeon]|nr:hypothetical protein [Candidatus Haiyanarchaeum thermophilum]MCW1303322.1 hypothetical protein [Candidatus Haiyanarchaeum thermophilum]MCW1304096.1 hypothetical protein [Candidatus Haiyanarchaeum thermophilum]MCW1306481.1 hypothetical protein [Candidatus Haiyanarchaeum thermophilum]MCW1307222.1 hypothetical protein [Candidatus Haiyanarchaeum thermophilum]